MQIGWLKEIAGVAALLAAGTAAGAGELRPRVAMPKAEAPELDTKRVDPDRLVLKFAEGTRVRLRGGTLVAEASKRTAEEVRRMERAGLTDEQLAADLAALAAAVPADGTVTVERLFWRLDEPWLEQQRQAGEAAGGAELADLDLYYRVTISPRDTARSKALLEAANALSGVELAYAQPLPAVPLADRPPRTGSFEATQTYLNSSAAFNGIDARYAWTIPGGRGQGVQLIDMELGWHLTHEDMPPVFYSNGTFWREFEHGTAVVGVVAAEDNGFGTTGIAPDTEIGVQSPGLPFFDPALAVVLASGQLQPGDIILLEVAIWGPDSGLPPGCEREQHETVPLEWDQAVFDAVALATSSGRIVVQAAANGNMDLDHERYRGLFSRAVRDSGAVMVGAGFSADRSTQCFSNAGSRVDVQGWGNMVATLSYGDVTVPGAEGDVLQHYTGGFNGTSSASPIVAGAISSVQGMLKARGQRPLDSFQARRFLGATGADAPAGETRPIGRQPDLRAAEWALPKAARAAFLHQTSSANIVGYISYLDHPDLNQNPAATVVVTHVYNPPNGDPRVFDHPVGVVYNSSIDRWGIFMEDATPMPEKVAFHVTAAQGFMHTAATPDGHTSVIEHPFLDGNPGVVVQVTQRLNPGGAFNPHPVGAVFDEALGRWRVANLDGAALPANASFNIAFSHGTAMSHWAEAPPFHSSDRLKLRNPALARQPDALVNVTATGGSSNVGVSFDGSGWWVYNEDGRPIAPGTRYHVDVRRRLESATVRLRESDGLVSSGLTVWRGDEVRIACHGRLENGVLLAAAHGPWGWLGDAAPASFPAPGLDKFSVVGTIGGAPFFGVGAGERFRADDAGALDVRINDDVPGNGRGWFTCRVEVWR
jgi:hypothetical protein